MKSVHRWTSALFLGAAVAATQVAWSQDGRSRQSARYQNPYSSRQDDDSASRQDDGRSQQSTQQRSSQSQREQQRRTSQGRESQNKQSSQREISGGGQVLQTKRVDVAGTDVRHLVVLLKTRRGNRRIVDLGPTDNFRRVSVRNGDMISVKGRVVNVGDRQVLMASQATVDGERVDIKRKLDMSKREVARRLQGEGEILESRKMRERRSGDDHILAVVQTRSGKHLVDLGPADKLQDVRFVRGDTVAVSGRVIAVGNRKLWVADKVEIDGRTVTIQDIRSKQDASTDKRTATQQRQQQQKQQRQQQSSPQRQR